MNKIKLILLFVLICLLHNCSNIIQNRNFNKITQHFLNEYFRTFPIEATLLGQHDYDHRLDNFSQEKVDEFIRFLKLTSEKIALTDTTKLNNRNRINYRILTSQLQLKLFELEQWLRWRKDAGFYIQKIDDAIYGLQIYRSDTTLNRIRKLMARLDQVPVFLEQAKKNLQSADIVNVNHAIESIENLSRIIAFQLSNQFLLTDTLFDSLNKKSEIVVDSLESFKSFLESNSTPSRSQAPSMTAENYQDYVNLLLDNELKLAELTHLLEADYQAYYQKITEVAQSVLNNTRPRNPFNSRLNSVEAAYDEIQKKSLTRDEIIPFCYETISNLKRFIDEIMNLSLPIDFNIEIDWWDENRVVPLKMAELEQPGLLSPALNYYCHLRPVLNNRDWLGQLSQLRDYNKPAIKVTIMRQAVPIHYHFWNTKLNKLPLLARIFSDQIFLSAWQYYFAFSLLNNGFEGFEPELQYMLLRDYLRNVLLAKVEIQYYLQQQTTIQLERVFLESKLFQKNELEPIFNQMNCSPGQALVESWGFKLLKQMEHSCRASAGPHFNFQEFIGYLLAQGPIAIELIQPKVVKELISNQNIN